MIFYNSLLNNAESTYSPWSVGIVSDFLLLIHYASAMIFLAFILSASTLLFTLITSNPWVIKFIACSTAMITSILLVIDSHVFILLKSHLNQTLCSLIFSGKWQGVFDFSVSELIQGVALIALIFIVECILSIFIWNKIFYAKHFGQTIIIGCWTFGVLGYYCLYLLSPQQNTFLAKVLPNVNLLTDKAEESKFSDKEWSQPMNLNQSLNYPKNPLRCQAPKIPYNIILIGVDSLRFDSLQPKYMPEVSKFAAKNWQFKNHISGGNATKPGLFSLFYSIPVTYWTAAMMQKQPSVLMTLLQQYGYTTRVFWGSQFTTPPFDKIIFMTIPKANTHTELIADAGDRDRQVSNNALDFLKSVESKTPFFLHLFYHAPHAYCSKQSFPVIYKPIQKNCSRFMSLNNNTDPSLYYNRYLNAVKFIDTEIARVINYLDNKGYMKNSIIIFTADHGQEFNDNNQNYWEHGSNYTRTQTHVPFVIHWPQKKSRQFGHITSSYDLVPTLLQNIFSCSNPVSDYSIGQNLLKKHDRLPFVLSGSYINMGIIEPQRLTTLEPSGTLSIADSKAAPLNNALPDPIVIQKALFLMRYYFNNSPSPSTKTYKQP